MDARSGVTKDLFEGIESGDGAQLGCSLNAHKNRLCACAARSSVPAGGLAVDDRGANGLFGAIVRGVDVRSIEKEEQAIAIPEQVDGEAKALVMQVRLLEEAIHLRFDLPFGDAQAAL